MNGNWRGTRNPTIEEDASIGGATHQLGFGEFTEYTYVAILTYKPKYLHFLIEEGNRGHIDSVEISRMGHAQGCRNRGGRRDCVSRMKGSIEEHAYRHKNSDY